MTLKPISASRIESFKMCKRREAFLYRQGNWEEDKGAAKAGKQVHALLEAYLRDGTPIDESILGDKYSSRKTWDGTPVKREPYQIGKLAKLMSAILPTPGTAQAEVKFTANLQGIEFKGVYDYSYGIKLGDHKTTSNLLYRKKEKELDDDTQRLIYTEYLPHVEVCEWNYGQWNRWDSKLKDYTGLLTDVTKYWVDKKLDKERFKLHVLTPAEEILNTPDDVDPLSLPLPDGHEDKRNGPCAKYPPSGCPFKDKCFSTDKKETKVAKKSKLLDMLKTEEAPVEWARGEETPAEKLSPTEKAELKEVFEGRAAATFEPLTHAQAEETRTILTTERMQTLLSQPGPFDKVYLIDTLFLDCLPVSKLDAELTYGYELLARASRIVADDAQQPHARLIDFGKGEVWIAVEFLALLEQNPVKYLYLESKSAEGRAVLQAALSNARLVVKGVF